ncbi:DUF6894 family protein [Roseicella sp. DB1501]|uniref:DUF6894 family protein n=1 Tax=Roseicella sp. DB1501 TaxID=2730925 RepID=UPI0038D111D5
MPRFFFDIDDGETQSTDEEGTELLDGEAASREATSVLPEIARNRRLGGNRRDLTCDVRNGGGQVIFTTSLSQVGRWLKQPLQEVS